MPSTMTMIKPASASLLFFLWSILRPCNVASFSSEDKSLSRVESSRLSATQQATFGMGCFWKPSEELLKVEGVQDTVVGYVNGKSPSSKPPNYSRVCYGSERWVEGVRVVYDDSKLSYEDLLDHVLMAQEAKPRSRQYGAYIFPHSDEQATSAHEWIQASDSRMAPNGLLPSMTQVERLDSFYQAEGYHQRYWQKQRPRFALIIALLAVSTGVLDSVTPLEWHSTIRTGANGAVVLAGLWQLLERVVDAKVVPLR